MTLSATSDEVLHFIKDAQELIEETARRNGYENPSKLFVEEGKTFLKIVSKNTFKDTFLPGGSAWGFIAKDDGNNKGMGSWKRGDLFKAASWAVPAKHARGNVIDKHWNIGPYGPAYLK
jgi:hypothetical protein